MNHTSINHLKFIIWIKAMNINEEYLKALTLLRDKNIKYVIIKFPYIVKKSFSDLDVLLYDADYFEAITILQKAGFVLYRSERYFEKFKTVMVKFISGAGFVKIHLHRKIAWCGKIIMNPEDVIPDRIEINQWLAVPKKEDSLLINIGHFAFESFKLTAHDFKLIKKLLKENLNWMYLDRQAEKFCWAKKFKIIVLRIKRMQSFKSICLKKKFSFSLGWLARVLNLRKKGGFICLLGVDGAGKTTTAREIADIMRIVEEKTYPVYIGWKPFLPTSKLMHLIGYFFKKENKKTPKEYQRSEKCDFLNELIFLHFFFEHISRYLFEIYLKLRRTHCLVADRYFYDILAQNSRANNSKFLKLLLKIFPRPDLIFFLDNKPEVIFRRKKEFKIAELKRQRNQYIKLSRIIPIKKVNTSSPIPKVAEKIIDLSWRKLVTKMAW